MPAGLFPSIRTLKKVDKKKLCIANITAFTVIMDHYELSSSALSMPSPSYLPLTSKAQMSNLLYPVIYPEKFEINRDYIENLSDKSQDYKKITVKVDGESIVVDALPCINHENLCWYIASGYVDDLYFTLESTPTNDSCTVTGMLEPLPQPVTYSCSDKFEKMENEYMIGQQKTGE